MKHRSYIKFILVNTLTFPLRLIAYVWAVFLYIHLRAEPIARKSFNKIEGHERAFRIRR